MGLQGRGYPLGSLMIGALLMLLMLLMLFVLFVRSISR